MTHRENESLHLEDVHVGVSVTPSGADFILEFHSSDSVLKRLDTAWGVGAGAFSSVIGER